MTMYFPQRLIEGVPCVSVSGDRRPTLSRLTLSRLTLSRLTLSRRTPADCQCSGSITQGGPCVAEQLGGLASRAVR